MLAGRIIAVIIALRVAVQVPLGLWLDTLRVALVDRTLDPTETMKTYAFVNNVYTGADAVLALAITLAFALNLRGAWPKVGAAAGALGLLTTVGSLFAGEAIRSNYPLAVSIGIVGMVTWFFVLIAASRALPAIFAIVGLLVVAIFSRATYDDPLVPRSVVMAVHALATLTVAAMAWREAPAKAGATTAAPTTDAPGTEGLRTLPTACRGIVACISLRVLIVAASVVLGATWLRTEAGLPHTVPVLRGVFLAGSLVDLAMLAYLVLYARAPRLWRGRWIETGLGLYVLSWICAAIAAHQSLELTTLLLEAKRATSIWGMPSLSKMEELQFVANWSLRAAMALGLGTGLAVASAALASARALDDLPLVHRARHLVWLVGGIGGIALVASIGLVVVKRVPTEAILVVGGALLLAAAYVLTTWFRVFLPLASRVESMHTR